jgi:hypothetical protein
VNLIVVSNLTCDEGLYFRYISMMASQELNYDVLVEARKKDVDHYFNLLKEKGWHDFVIDFIQPEWRIEGVRIDDKLNYPRTIQVPHIRCENTLNILGQLKEMRRVIF